MSEEKKSPFDLAPDAVKESTSAPPAPPPYEAGDATASKKAKTPFPTPSVESPAFAAGVVPKKERPKGVLSASPHDGTMKKELSQGDAAAILVSIINEEDQILVQMLSRPWLSQHILEEVADGGRAISFEKLEEFVPGDPRARFNRLVKLGVIFFDKDGTPVSNPKVSELIAQNINKF